MSVPGRPEGADADSTVRDGDGDYAAPVDPWATAEANAMEKDGHVPFHMVDPRSPAQPNSTWTMPGAEPETTVLPPARTRVLRSYRKGILTAIGAGAAALGVTAAVIFWPEFPALGFHQLDEESRHDPAVEISSLWSDTEVIGERAYFANAGTNGTVGVVAIDTESREEVWRTTVTMPGVTGWDQMVATPAELVLYSTLNASSKITMVVLDTEDDGRKLWDRPIGSSDTVHLGSKKALLADRGESRLLWLDLKTGDVTHEEDDPDASTVIAAGTPDDLKGPSSTQGRPLNARVSGNRVVQVNGDNSVRVLDIDSGKLLASANSAASTSNDVLAHDGRLFVEETSGGTGRIFAYSLDEMGEPATLYTAPENATMSLFSPCGEGRLCFVETGGYDRAKDQVVAVDAAEGGKVWSLPLAQVETLTPVGDSLLASTRGDTDDVTLIDAKGDDVWTVPGRAARLDGANILRFADPLTTSKGNRTLSGVHLGDDSEPMGEIRDVYPSSCSWNTTVLACVGEKQFLIYRFA